MRTRPIRKGKMVCFNIDVDAYALLKAMQPNGKGFGSLLSELVRKEARERVGRAQWVAQLTESQAS